MSIASFVVVFVIAFWLVLFMVLPIGVQRDDDVQEGNDPGAPKRHMVAKKMLWAGIVAVGLTVLYWYAVDVLGLSILPENY